MSNTTRINKAKVRKAAAAKLDHYQTKFDETLSWIEKESDKTTVHTLFWGLIKWTGKKHVRHWADFERYRAKRDFMPKFDRMKSLIALCDNSDDNDVNIDASTAKELFNE